MDTLNEAISKRKDVHGLVIHSDQGFQYTSLEEYIQLIEEWIEFYNTTRIKGKKINKKKGYKKNDK